jgi:hypothetical protein
MQFMVSYKLLFYEHLLKLENLRTKLQKNQAINFRNSSLNINFILFLILL